MLNSLKHASYKNVLYDRLKSEITFQQYRENLAKTEFSDGL